jgi:hypothetical protein
MFEDTGEPGRPGASRHPYVSPVGWLPAVFAYLSTGPNGEPDWAATLVKVLAAGPGPETTAVLTMAQDAELDELTRLLLVRAWEAQLAHSQALAHDALAKLAGEPGPDDELTEAEVGTAIGVSSRTVSHRLSVARALSQRLPATSARLRAGELTYGHVCALVDELVDVDAATAGEVETQLYARIAPGQVVTPSSLRARARRILARLDAAAMSAKHAAAAASPTVIRAAGMDGTTELVATLGAADAALVWQCLTDQAQRLRQPDEHRPLDYWRAQALLSWAQHHADRCPGASLPAGATGEVGPTVDRPLRAGRVQVGVVVDLATLLGLTDEPGQLLGHGPIPAGIARQLAADGAWQRWVTDPDSGHLLDLGRRSYRPSAALRDFVVARDQTCTFPGCAVPSVRCDLDHEVPWDEGGTTDAEQLQALCRRHHRFKTERSWTVKRDPATGTATWTSRLGEEYTSPRFPVLEPPLADPPPDDSDPPPYDCDPPPPE